MLIVWGKFFMAFLSGFVKMMKKNNELSKLPALSPLIWPIENRRVDSLIEHKRNPRTITEKNFNALKDRILSQGFRTPPSLDNNGVILAGHQRIRALIDLGMGSVEIPVSVPPMKLTKALEKEIIASDNLSWGEFDFDMLANDYDLKELKGYGFTEAQLLGIPTVEESETYGDDDVPDVKEDPLTVKGDLYELGAHRVLCGDSTVIDDVEKLMDGVKADMVFTDPPYGLGIDGQKKSVAKNPKHSRKSHDFKGWDNSIPSSDFFKNMHELDIPCVVFGGNYMTEFLPPSKGWVFWNKGQEGQLTMSDGELAWTNQDKVLRSVTVNRAGIGNSSHPTQKPLEVIAFCLNYIGNGKKVLDFFLGSGSTLIACEKTNRKCFGMELSEQYCDVIVKRYIAFCKKNDRDYHVLRNGKICKDFEE